MKKVFDLPCRNCGAPVGYDILTQSYRCTSCGQVSGVREFQKKIPSFRPLDRADGVTREFPGETVECPNCGAEVVYPPGEASTTCPYCRSRLIRQAFEDSDRHPEYVIPFVLTKKEAVERLEAWGKEHPKTAPALVRKAKDLTGAYLPEQLIRGPVQGSVLREQSTKTYHVRGFMEGTLVSAVQELDNDVLNGLEPFDFAELRPFEHGYIAGHSVRFSDVSGEQMQKRALEEVRQDFLPEVRKVLQTEGLRVRLEDTDLWELPVLVPVYWLRVGDCVAAVNGQTGRVSVKTPEVWKRSAIRFLEPGLLSLLFGLFMQWQYHWAELSLMAAAAFALVCFTIYDKGHFSILEKKISQSQAQKARRVDKKLEFSREPLKNPFPNTPVFFETVDGKELPAHYRFYPPIRILEVAVQMLILPFLPWIPAGILHFGCHIGNFSPAGGVVWYIFSVLYLLLYFSTVIRQDAYSLPYIYVQNPEETLLRTPRRLSILRVFDPRVFVERNRLLYGEKPQKGQNPWGFPIIALSMLLLAVWMILV